MRAASAASGCGSTTERADTSPACESRARHEHAAPKPTARPLRHEADRFRASLNLKQAFEVRYWDQRGCGPVDKRDAYGVSLPRQVDDLRCMLRTIHAAEQRPVTVLGISLGATYTLLAAEREPDAVGPIVAFSVDTDARESAAAVAQFLNAQAALRADRRLSARVARLGSPPYTQTASFHLRARLIADLGGVVSLPMPTPVAVHPSFEVDRRGISRAA